VSVMYT